MTKLRGIIIFALMCQHCAVASTAEQAKQLVETRLNTVLSILQDKKGPDVINRKDMVVEILEPLFDFSTMAKLTLGRQHWPSLSDENKGRFTELFIARLADSFFDKLMLYTDEVIQFETPSEVEKKVHVPTILISKDNKIAMVYKLYRSKTDWKIYDIEIQGVSIIHTYRSQFHQILENGTVDDLLTKLKLPRSD